MRVARPTLMRPLRLCQGLPDLGAAVCTLVDEIEPGHAPERLNVPDIQRVSPAAGTHRHRRLDVAVLNIRWHVGSPSSASIPFQPPIRCYRSQSTILRKMDAHDQLLRTQEERSRNL